jgi:hypothetical protein
MDYETTADLNDAIHYERLDADLEMANLYAQAAHTRALNKRGICTHGSRLGRRVPAFYDADDIAGMLRSREEGGQSKFGNRGGFDGPQDTIPHGKDLCTDCGELVEAWHID